MVDIATNLIATPSGFWINIISFFESFTFNYILAIVLITIIIKLILSPLDFLNKKVTRDNSEMQAVIKPQLEKLQKQYGHDKNLLNQKTMELYKSNGFSMGGSCAVMLVYMAISIAIFFTLFSSLNTMSHFKLEQQYIELQSEYIQVYNQTSSKEAGQEAVIEIYDNNSSKFLWVKNIWLADNPWTNAVMDFKGYKNNVGDQINMKSFSKLSTYTQSLTPEQMEQIISGTDDNKSISLKGLKAIIGEEQYNQMIINFEAEYNDVMAKVFEERNGPNGFLITTLLAMATAFLSQWLMQRKTKIKNANNGVQMSAGGSSKILLIVLPLIMGVFTLLYNAVFGMYIIANQLVALITFPIIDKILDKHYAKKARIQAEKVKVEYSRTNVDYRNVDYSRKEIETKDNDKK